MRTGLTPSCHHVQDITSPCSQAFLRTVIPLSLLVVLAACHIPIPSSIRRAFAPFSIIFYDQAALTSLVPAGIKIKRRGPELWRQVAFVVLAAIGVVLWTGVMGYEIVRFVSSEWPSSAVSSWPIWSSATAAMIWVSPGKQAAWLT
jgi:predicted membrane channel-forming protein YqfA (hemolysin III family)